MRRLGRGRLLLLLAVVGPGLITSAADNDANGIITYTAAGARYRFDMLWVIVVITFVLAMVQEMGARMGVVTQKGLGELIRENFGVRWTMFALGTLLVANLSTTVADFAGLAAALSVFGIPKYVSVPASALVIWLLVVKGSFKTVERVFMSLIVIYATYVISGFMAKPDWHEVAAATLRPNLRSETHFLFLTIAVIGTTITPWMQFFLQAAVVDKGVRIDKLGYQKWDVYIGSVLTDLVSFFIIVSAARMIYDVSGGPVAIDTAEQAAAALSPVAGGYAAALFALGLFGASFLASSVVPLSTAYTYSEAFGFEIGISRKLSEAPVFYGIYTLCVIIGAAVVMVPNAHLINMMIGAQAVNGILLPVTLVFMLKLTNRADVMGKHVNSRIYNAAVWAMAVVLIALTIAWLVGVAVGL